ncbi:MAG: (d)CMP kinase [Oligoflexia bacterium]|nr:(d)CMP kinase [Oligoflexia bacterium]
MPIAIAIDGPAASGKGTVARGVARRLGYRYLDTGAMYRAVALLAQQRGVDWTDSQALGRLARQLDLDFRWDGEYAKVLVDGHDISGAIRSQEIGWGASAVAVHPSVRSALVARQRVLADHGGVVVDGRDIGSVVLPQAELKIYLDATLDERARRRHDELRRRGIHQNLAQVRDEVAARDAQDSGRATGPLAVAPGAVRVDTTNHSIAEVIEIVAKLAKDRCP